MCLADILGIVLMVLLLVVEVLQEEPLMPVRLLGRPIALAGIVIAIVAGTVFTGTLGHCADLPGTRAGFESADQRTCCSGRVWSPPRSPRS